MDKELFLLLGNVRGRGTVIKTVIEFHAVIGKVKETNTGYSKIH